MAYKYTKRISLGYADDGTLIRKRVYANSKAELDRRIHDVLSEYEKAPLSSDITFQEYATTWLNTYKSAKEAATKEMYTNILRKTEDIDYMSMKDIRQADLQLLINDNSEHPNVCSKMRLTFRQIWACAVEEGILSTDVTKRLEVPKTSVTQGRALTDEEKQAIKDANLTDMERLYVSLLYYLGVRPQEALAFCSGDVADGHATVERAVGFDGNRPYIKPTKTGNTRKIPIPDALQELLDNYHADSYLIHNKDGDLMSKTVKSDFWLSIKHKIEQAIIAKHPEYKDYKSTLRPYTFRHNYCTMCYYSKLSLKKCQYLMGHSSIQMIMQVYAHLDDEQEPLDSIKSMKM